MPEKGDSDANYCVAAVAISSSSKRHTATLTTHTWMQTRKYSNTLFYIGAMTFCMLAQDDTSSLFPSVLPIGIAFTFAVSIFAAYLVLGPARALRGIPGPLIGKITSLYRVWVFGQGDGAAKAMELHRKYGDVVQTGPNHVIVANVEALSQIYGTNLSKVG